MAQPTRQQIRSWINRQRTLKEPSQLYIEWLRKQFRIEVKTEVIKPISGYFFKSDLNTTEGDQ